MFVDQGYRSISIPAIISPYSALMFLLLTFLHTLLHPLSLGTVSQIVPPFLAGGSSSSARGSLSPPAPLLPTTSSIRRSGLVSVMRRVISREQGGSVGKRWRSLGFSEDWRSVVEVHFEEGRR